MPSMAVGRRAALLAIALAAVVPRASRAADPTAAELSAARELFQQGIALEEKLEWAAALETFRKVAAVKTTAPVRFHIAFCLENLGQLVEAYNEFMRARGEAESDPKPEAVTVREQADKHLADLKARIPRLTIVVDEGEGIEVAVDGKPVNSALLGTPFPLDPGAHRITASGKNGTFAKSVTLAERGEPKTLHVVLGGADAPVDKPSSKLEPPGATAWIAAGAGVALTATSLVLYSMSRAAYREVDAACGDRPLCPRSLEARYEEGRSYNTWGNVLLVTGMLSIGAGVVLWATAPKGEPKTAAGSMTFALGPSGLGVAGAF